MRPIIKQLPEEIINLISAGEVVERPVSVVKELVENAIDANSTIITVELIDGGIKKIKVTDNGIGMTKDEIPVALSPHSTSKINHKDDLFNISTLGFRGEALPSILSVSKFNIKSKTIEDKFGFYYLYESGKLIESGSVPMNEGTIIEVSDLFYNTPARFKHLSSVHTENAYITDYLYKSALSHPEITFKLFNNDKLIYNSESSDLLEIIGKTYGFETAKGMISFSANNSLYKIEGYTSNNQTFRSNKNSITILVNNRVIKNPLMIYAVTDAYKSIIPIGKYPITVIKISCNPSVVDVNVHPSKAEIRFTDEYALKMLITKTISDALINTDLIYNNITENYDYSKTLFDEVSKNTETIKEEKTIELNWDSFEEVDVKKEIIEEDVDDNLETESEEEVFEKPKIEQVSINASRSFKFTDLRYIGQYKKTYLLMEDESNLYLIDQHAAAERVNYEKILKSFENLSINKMENIELLVPLIIHFDVVNTVKINNMIDEFVKYGLIIEYFGGNSFKISHIPSWIIPGTEEVSVTEMIEGLINNTKVSKDVLYNEMAKSMSCKKSIKANMSILDEEVNHLMKELDLCNMPFTCPHGRPTLIKFSTYELEKLFKRVI